ncbi:hypothetical protein Tco_0150679 [Tanacetum coccineum]
MTELRAKEISMDPNIMIQQIVEKEKRSKLLLFIERRLKKLVSDLSGVREEDDVEPGVIFGRSFLRLTKGIVDFGNGILTIYPEGDCRKTFTLLFIPETPKNACQIHKSWEASASNIMKGSDK